MALLSGTQLGPYEILSPLGAGGMGEVYRARDTKLGRDVALKILPTEFALDADRLSRFKREAQVLASLDHPNIGAIYGFEESEGIHALVLQLVDGPTLADRIAQGPIPVDETLPIARQIAEALEAAHEKGVIHRDLKPANIKVRPDGTVKVLDFGLAKLLEPDAVATGPGRGYSAALTNSPTITSPALTMIGVILGTAGYMSPEQARGKAVDRRIDIWAFGVVLFEMLTGTRAFAGDDVADVLSRVLQREPDLTTLPARTPAPVQTLVARCLVKDPHRRLRDIGEARLVLEGAFETAAPQTTGTATRATRRERLAWGSTALALIGLATVSLLRVRETPVEPPRVHLSVTGNGLGFFALSPDGRSLVINTLNGLGVRSLESTEIRLLTGTGLARTPFWSPDSRTIGFFADGRLKTIAASGGPPRTLCDAGFGEGGTWNRAGVILFTTESGVLTRVLAAGGACTALTKPERVGHQIPVFLPDGDHFLYARGGTDEAQRGLYVASLSDPNGRRLLADPSSAVFVPNAPASNHGRLLFVREQTLMAQAFDATVMQLSGEPTIVANQVAFTTTPPQIAASADASGTIVYLANGRPDRQLIWYDRSGTERGRAAMTSSVGSNAVSLAPDGKRVAFRRTDAQGLVSLWVQDLERHQETRVTTPPLTPGSAVWSPDGTRLAFGATGLGADGIYAKDVNGGKEEMLLPGSNSLAPSDWSRDDLSLVYTETNRTSGADIWVLAAPSKPSAERKPVPLLRTPSNESQGQLSPDGKWIAYASDEGGSVQVYLRPFGGLSVASHTKWQVSNASTRSAEPRWRGDGKELFYLESFSSAFQQHKVMAVPIGAEPNPAGMPKLLFEFRSIATVEGANAFLYSPAADGQRFLVNTSATVVQPSIEVILNWGRTSGTK